MSNNPDVHDNGTLRSSHLSPSSGASSPVWGPPKSPLPPHRLAKLANALGVSTPMPAVHNPTPFMSRSFSDSGGPLDNFRRSPTPSTSASNYNVYTPSVSKYLLHVIPPLHLPHETDDDSDMTPPPPTASGYHTQFRRGTLVPVHASLQSQLGAIAKEYALPSTAGLILYLVSSAKSVQERSSTPSIELVDDTYEPGPRLSEDIWKHLWTRIMKAEQRDDYLLPSPISRAPTVFGLALGAQSTPFLPHESNGQPLRPLITTNGTEQSQLRAYTPSPSTPSSGSDMRSNTKSPSVSQSEEPETPDTSSGPHSFHNDPATRANSLDLPGLQSSSVIPILAKVEFDIDRRKAAWYDPWLRSRRMNHAKRAESRMGRKASVNDGEQTDGSRERQPPIGLLTKRKETASPVSFLLSSADNQESETISVSIPVPDLEPKSEPEAVGYEELPESHDDDGWSEDGDSDGEEFTDEFTARVVPSPADKDPLADIFGDDADTWATIQHSTNRNSKRQTNPNVVELALNGADLTALPSPTQSEFEHLGREEDEVQALLDQISRPNLSVTVPPSPPTGRKHVPPPLVLASPTEASDLVVPAEPSPFLNSAGSTSLAYLNDSPEEAPQNFPIGGDKNQEQEEFEKVYTRVRTPSESEKRGGAVFDDLDLGLDPTEDFDDDDPHDRRRSQYLMKAQLDEIERTMAQLSPRILQTDLAEEQNSFMSERSVNLSPGLTNGEFFPPSPRLPHHLELVDNNPNRESLDPKKQAAWPAVSFASLHDSTLASPAFRSDGPPSPPRLAVNGVTTSAPRSYTPNARASTSGVSTETESRKRELEEEQGYAAGRKSPPPSESPIIPLSPDPFGRFSSTPDPPTGSQKSLVYWETDPTARSSPLVVNETVQELPSRSTHDRNRNRSYSSVTSRFSADSITGEETTKTSSRSTLITVNTIKKLWRKSNKNSSSSSSSSVIPPTPTSAGFPSLNQPPPPRPERPSLEVSDGPLRTPTFGRFSPQLAPPPPPPPRLSQEQLAVPQSQPLAPPFNGRSSNPTPIVAAQMRPARENSGLDRLHFDQESPYPIRRAPYSRPPSPPQPASPNPPTSSLPPQPSSTSANIAPPVEKEKTRKSILKGWKSGAAQAPPPVSEPRSSTERPNANGARGRRPSVLNFGSTRGSTTSPEIPPSPPIPYQYLEQRNDRRQSVRSKLTSSSIDSSNSPPQTNRTLNPRSSSPQRSMASSRDSQETRPSFDTSQFEIVSPKINSTLSYPYHGLDHD